MQDIRAYLVSIPATVKGVTVLKDNDYIIFINECLSEKERQETLEHELAHISKDHFFDSRNIVMLEKECLKNNL